MQSTVKSTAPTAIRVQVLFLEDNLRRSDFRDWWLQMVGIYPKFDTRIFDRMKQFLLLQCLGYTFGK